MDVLLELPAETRRSTPATPTRRPSPTSWRATRFVRIWRGLDPEGSEPCTALGEPATLILLGDDYDGGHKAWVRWPDGARRHRARLAGRRGAPSRPDGLGRWRDDKIPTSRVRRTARVGRLAAGQAVTQFGTRAANVTRDERPRRRR